MIFLMICFTLIELFFYFFFSFVTYAGHIACLTNSTFILLQKLQKRIIKDPESLTVVKSYPEFDSHPYTTQLLILTHLIMASHAANP